MTSDTVQNTYIPRDGQLSDKVLSSRRFAGKRRARAFGIIKKSPPELPQNNENNTLANTNIKVEDAKEKKAGEGKGAIDKTALLKTAYKMLRQIESELVEKEDRIQTLQEILTVDELTGLTNRRGFFRAFEGELDRTNRGENAGGLLIMVDLDQFKAINDSFGHMAGDEALRTVGNFLYKATRPMDIVARLAGDEFIILMPGANIGSAMIRARKMGNALNDLTFDWKDETVRISASIGLKEYVQGDTIENIIDQADQGLYQDKKARREVSSFAAE